MYQAFVYSGRDGKTSQRDFPDVEHAAQSLAALLRSSGHTGDRDELAAQLATGQTIAFGHSLYWVKEVA